MSDKTPKLDELIGHTPLGRILKKDDIAAEFALIRRAFETAGKVAPDTNKFRQVGQLSGTHLLKLITPRAKIGQHLLKVQRATANEATALTPSTDARLAPVAKILFRPLEVEGRAPRCLVDHILNPDELSPSVTKAFSKVFGDDALVALRESLASPLPAITTLPVAEFPIIYLPRPGGKDLQVTPIAPAEAYIRFRDVTEPYFIKKEEGAPPVPRGRWHRQLVTTKQQNISSAVGQRRTRFLATLPRVLDRYSAELHRYAQGGRFPRWRDERVVEALAGYAALLDTRTGYTAEGYDPSKAHSNEAIRRHSDERADRLIDAARVFIDQMLDEVERRYPDAPHREEPKVRDVILSAPQHNPDASSENFERDRARRVLLSDHFKGRLEAAREQ